MIELNIISQIEDKCICETEKIVAELKKKLKNNQKIIVETGEFKECVDKTSVIIAVRDGNIKELAMQNIYEMNINIYFSIISSNSKDDISRRRINYPILTAILYHFSGLSLKLNNGKSIKLEPKGDFRQNHNAAPYLEYNCTFSARITIDKNEDETGGELLGIIAEYYIDPEKNHDSEPDYSEELIYGTK